MEVLNIFLIKTSWICKSQNFLFTHTCLYYKISYQNTKIKWQCQSWEFQIYRFIELCVFKKKTGGHKHYIFQTNHWISSSTCVGVCYPNNFHAATHAKHNTFHAEIIFFLLPAKHLAVLFMEISPSSLWKHIMTSIHFIVSSEGGTLHKCCCIFTIVVVPLTSCALCGNISILQCSSDCGMSNFFPFIEHDIYTCWWNVLPCCAAW